MIVSHVRFADVCTRTTFLPEGFIQHLLLFKTELVKLN